MSRSLGRFLMHAIHGFNTPYRRRSGRRKVRRGPARSWKYRRWIRSLPSVVSGSEGCEAAHTGGDGGTAQKASDFSCIPLTAAEHIEYHSIGRLDFERRHGINCRELVKRLNSAWFAYASEAK